jgi:hypothetical protein
MALGVLKKPFITQSSCCFVNANESGSKFDALHLKGPLCHTGERESWRHKLPPTSIQIERTRMVQDSISAAPHDVSRFPNWCTTSNFNRVQQCRRFFLFVSDPNKHTSFDQCECSCSSGGTYYRQHLALKDRLLTGGNEISCKAVTYSRESRKDSV